jgi:glycosyltransferase involved in cell wall biosynthesis
MKRVSLIFWEGYLDASPTLISLIGYLAEKKIQVDLYIRDDNDVDMSVASDFDNTLVNVFKIKTQEKNEVLRYLLLQSKRLKYLRIGFMVNLSRFISAQISDLIKNGEINRFISSLQKIRKPEYDIVFCIDTIGLYAFEKSNFKTSKVVYVSLEILARSGEAFSWLNNRLKNNEEKMLNNRVMLTLIQDEHRWKLFSATNHYGKNNYLVLPNTDRKHHSAEGLDKSYFFYDKFSLNKDTFIVLSAGMISEYTSSKELSKVIGAYEFSKPTKVIFHERFPVVEETPYLKEIRTLGRNNLLLSLTPVPYKELYRVFSSAHIGLVIYNKNSVDNMSVIGNSSGKLYQYLKYGIPVIASNLPGMDTLVTENELGILVDAVNEVPQAIEKIRLRYAFYSTNARKAFDEKLNIDNYLNTIYKEIA